ncbi:MAG: exodeoxyribonuclease III, partial [FCB group bacterium]|nr:exodeoxyribonuclease III [FCB group bacterium]
IDLARPKQNENTSGFLPIERAWMDKFESQGYVDTFRHIHPDAADRYSWWSYRAKARENNVGWRIDYFYVTSDLLPYVKDADILDSVMGSDHCPVSLELEVKP